MRLLLVVNFLCSTPAQPLPPSSEKKNKNISFGKLKMGGDKKEYITLTDKIASRVRGYQVEGSEGFNPFCSTK